MAWTSDIRWNLQNLEFLFTKCQTTDNKENLTPQKIQRISSKPGENMVKGTGQEKPVVITSPCLCKLESYTEDFHPFANRFWRSKFNAFCIVRVDRLVCWGNNRYWPCVWVSRNNLYLKKISRLFIKVSTKKFIEILQSILRWPQYSLGVGNTTVDVRKYDRRS